MTLACGNASSFVAKLSTNCACAQSLVVSFIGLSILGVRIPMMDRGARRFNRVPRLSTPTEDAA